MLDPSLCILIVEDDRKLRHTIAGTLRLLGAQNIISVANGSEALRAVLENPVDFILCGWNTSELSGLEFLRAIRNNPITKTIPFVMTSGRGEIGDDEFAETTDLDVDAHLIKPFSQEKLENLVNNTLAKREKLKKSSVHISRAAAYVDMGAMEEAEAEMDSAHQMPPEVPRFWVESAKIFEKLENDEKAKNCYQQAAEVDMGYAKAYEGLAGILEKEGKVDEALEMLQKSVDLSPRNRGRQLKMAKALLNNGDEDGARIALYQALEDETDPAARSAEAAEFFMESGRADLAEVEYAFALEADPNNVHYYNRLGLAFRRQKKNNEAIENYQKALSVAPDDSVIYYNMAVAHTEGGNTEQALATLRKALTLRPDFSQAEGLLKKLKAGVEPAAKSHDP